MEKYCLSFFFSNFVYKFVFIKVDKIQKKKIKKQYLFIGS